MRMVGVMSVSAVLALVSAPGWSDEIYHWTDGHGGVHFSNTPTAGVPWTRLSDGQPAVAGATPGVPPAPPTAAAGQPDADAGQPSNETFSADVSLRRNALERDLRASRKRLKDIDGRLATLARARNQHAGGSAATGGVGTLALDLRSDEERALAAEREQLSQHVDETRNDGVKLRDEITARLGETPAWWNELR